MQIKRAHRLNLITAFLLTPIFVGLTTYLLLKLQLHINSGWHIKTIRPYGIGFVVPIAAISVLGGRRPGLFALLLSLIALSCILFPLSGGVQITDPRMFIEFIMLLVVGALIVLGFDAMYQNAQLLAETAVRARRETLLNQISQTMRTGFDPDKIQATAVAELAKALNVSSCYVAIYDHTNNEAWISHRWPAASDTLVLKRQQRIPWNQNLSALYQKGTLVIEDLELQPEYAAVLTGHDQQNLRSLVSVPLFNEQALVATLTTVMIHQPRNWKNDEIELVEAVAEQTRSTVDAARARQREHDIAVSLQDALVPTLPEKVPGLELASYYKAALEESKIGGDFYDVFPLENGVVALVVGDLSGKGLKAATQIATVRNMLRSVLYRRRSAEEAVTELNGMLVEHNLISGFATLFLGIFDSGSQVLTYVSCGHEPAFLKRGATRLVEDLPPTGPTLGIAENAVYQEFHILLSPGDFLMIYTDGLTESGPDRTSLLGAPQLKALLQDQRVGENAEKAVNTIIAAVENYAQRGFSDDVCVLGMLVQPSGSS